MIPHALPGWVADLRSQVKKIPRECGVGMEIFLDKCYFVCHMKTSQQSHGQVSAGQSEPSVVKKT